MVGPPPAKFPTHIPRFHLYKPLQPKTRKEPIHIAKMASITMTASFINSTSLVSQSPVTNHRRLVITNAARGTEVENVKLSIDTKKECNNGRRDLMFTAAAAAICSVAGMAVAEGPKPGSPEAKKLYAPVCVTMPTARICRN